ncbi:hypothetical protein [Lentilactobacillus curieae]|uniref:hypothetical protein n=1 Tax=Lentilactobacillus curieae TaxID=1138822 RepID=UPI000A4CC55F|nr:hypothetical protein [Lentilactobacillus curieae]
MNPFITLMRRMPRLHGIHRIFFFHLIFREQPLIGWAILVAVVLFLIYRYVNRR